MRIKEMSVVREMKARRELSVVREIKARREPRSRSRKVGRTNGELRTGTTLQLSLRKTVADLAAPLDRYDLSQIDEMYRYELTCLVSL